MGAPVAVVGMGGGGLAAAIRLVQNGQSVVIFESRDEFTRPQRIFVHGEAAKFIDELIDPSDPLDVQFKQSKFSNDDSIRVRSLQKFLYRKLMKLQEEKPNLLTVLRGEKFKITGIDPHNQILSYTESNQVKTQLFSHFLEADGAQHAMANLLNNAVGEDVFNFEVQEVQHRHPPCGVIQCQLNLPEALAKDPKLHDILKILTNVSWKSSDCEGLIAQGWNQPYFPRMFIYSDLKQMKFGFATELPDSLYALSRDPNKQKEFREKYLEWARFLFDMHIQTHLRSKDVTEDERKLLAQLRPKDLIILPKKVKPGRSEAYLNHFDRLNATAFKLEYFSADIPSAGLGKEGTYALVGDSFQTPWFYGSHGMNDAICGGLLFAESLDKNGKFDDETFDAQMQRIKETEFQSIINELERGSIANERFQNVLVDFFSDAQTLFEYLVMNDHITENRAQAVDKLMNKLASFELTTATLSELLQFQKDMQQVVQSFVECKDKLMGTTSPSDSRIIHAFHIKRDSMLPTLKKLEAFAANGFSERLNHFLNNNFPLPELPQPQNRPKQV